jgi:D-alanyl-D-alanine endopeptidase (penicillin-binding protein 7)
MRTIFITLLLLPMLCLAHASSVVYNSTNNTVISGSLDNQQVSIASISKLLTVYTILKANQNLDERLTVINRHTPHTKLSRGMKLTRKELIEMSLISSDNLAAITLAENYPGGYSRFIRKMNENADELNMRSSGFVEPTGLSPMNHSTINDLILLTNAVSTFDIVKTAAQTHQIITNPEVTIHKHKRKRKPMREPINRSINKKLVNRPTSTFFGKEGVITIKTGFTQAAGFCITMLVSSNNQLYNIVVLGARTKQERQRIIEKSLETIYNA